MKSIILATLFILFASIAFTSEGDMQAAHNNNVGIQGFANEGSLSQSLTLYSTTIDMTNTMAYGVYVPADCKVRSMPASNSIKSSYALTTIPGGSWYIRVKNSATPFVNFTGCTSGELQRQ